MGGVGGGSGGAEKVASLHFEVVRIDPSPPLWGWLSWQRRDVTCGGGKGKADWSEREGVEGGRRRAKGWLCSFVGPCVISSRPPASSLACPACVCVCVYFYYDYLLLASRHHQHHTHKNGPFTSHSLTHSLPPHISITSPPPLLCLSSLSRYLFSPLLSSLSLTLSHSHLSG